MFSKLRNGKAVWIGAASVILVVLFLIMLFIVQSSPKKQESIVLPPAVPNSSSDKEPISDPNTNQVSDFIELTNENVQTVLQTLNIPTAYHQSYTVMVGQEEQQLKKEIHLWVNGDLLHAEVKFEQTVQSLITDGVSAYLWYEDSPEYVSIEIREGVSPEDLLGLPDFDSYLQISQTAVVDTDYLFLDEEDVQCIYVCVQTDDNQTIRYWVNLSNGLLYQADALENSTPVYSIYQTAFEQLAIEDEIFNDRFVLPDGTTAFIAAARMPQS